MKEKTMVLLLLSIFAFLLAGKKPETYTKETNWKRVKNHGEILVSSRWYATQNAQIKEIKAETCVNIPKEKLLEIIQSGIYTSEWMPMVENYYVNPGLNKNQWDSQLTLGFFWPFSKNNLEISYNLLNDCENSSFIMFNSKKASVLDKTVKPKAYQFSGSWELIPVNSVSTILILKVKWDKKNLIHHWVATPIISENIFSSLKQLKQISEEKYKVEGEIMAATVL